MSAVDEFADFVGRVPRRTVALPWGDAPVWDLGEGPPVVLLHGIAAGRRMLFRLAGSLERGRRVVVPPLRGEDRRGLPFSLDDLLDDVAALLERLDLADVTLGGFSFGGYLALAYAARRDPRVARVVTQGAFARHPLALPDRLALLVAGWAPESWGRAYFRRRVRRGREQRMLAAHDPELAALNLEWQAQTPFPALRARARLIHRVDLADRLDRIEVPVTLVQGALDPVAPRALFERLRSLLPHAATHVIPDAAHLAPLTHPLTLRVIYAGQDAEG